MGEKQEKHRLIAAAFFFGILGGVMLAICINADDASLRMFSGMTAGSFGLASAFAGVWASLISGRGNRGT